MAPKKVTLHVVFSNSNFDVIPKKVDDISMSTHTNKAIESLEAAVAALKEERDSLDEQIKAMNDAIAQLGGKAARRGPGRPPGRKKPGPKPGSKRKTKAAATSSKKKKRNWSPAARKAASERMKKRWADRNKKKK